MLLRRVLLGQVCGSLCLWVAASAFAWLSLVRVSYREFGLSLSQTVPLDDNTNVLACA